jgi:hypothetical protein
MTGLLQLGTTGHIIVDVLVLAVLGVVFGLFWIRRGR